MWEKCRNNNNNNNSDNLLTSRRTNGGNSNSDNPLTLPTEYKLEFWFLFYHIYIAHSFWKLLEDSNSIGFESI